MRADPSQEGPVIPHRPRRAHVHGPQDIVAWEQAYAAGSASSPMPYGSERLGNAGFEVSYNPWQRPLPLRVLVRLADRMGPAAGRAVRCLLTALYAHRADLQVVLFDDNARALDVWRRLGLGGRGTWVLVACWLSETVKAATPAEQRRLGRAVERFDVVTVYSANQLEVLERLLPLTRAQVQLVRFGIDVQPFVQPLGTPAAANGESAFVLSVGGDAGRDFATLLRACEQAGVRCRLAAPAHRTAGLDVPQEVELLGVVGLQRYVQLVHESTFVVVPCHPLGYPTGQTAVLEAMAAGKAVVTTDTPAMRDYVRDGVDGLLVPPHDPQAMADVLVRLRDDPALRERLGAAAAQRVREAFTTDDMWDDVARHVVRQGVPA